MPSRVRILIKADSNSAIIVNGQAVQRLGDDVVIELICASGNTVVSRVAGRPRSTTCDGAGLRDDRQRA
ncbi:MAG TPA: hypothetical protein VII59_11820 [Streptosporangiaceae bacterium]|jgi:hypothetical protein